MIKYLDLNEPGVRSLSFVSDVLAKDSRLPLVFIDENLVSQGYFSYSKIVEELRKINKLLD